MNLGRVAAFVRVVEAGSFTAAAQALGLPKSSVSRAVQKLEEELGVQLLRRTTRALTLTDVGHAYFERVKGAIAALDEAQALAGQEGGAPRGMVRMTAAVDAGSIVLAPALARFCRAYPEIHVDLLLTSRRVDLVQEGVDLALRIGPLRDSTLVARKVGALKSALFAAPSYLERVGTPKKLADLGRHACVLFRAQAGRVTWRLTGPRGEEHVDVDGVLSADDLAFVRSTVLEGAGIGMLPAYACAAEMHEGRLVRVLPAYAFREATIYLVAPAARYVPARIAVLREFLLRELLAVDWAAERPCPKSPAKSAATSAAKSAAHPRAKPRARAR